MFQVKHQLYEDLCVVDVDSGDTMNKKIRNAQLAQYNFILGNSWNHFAILEHVCFSK